VVILPSEAPVVDRLVAALEVAPALAIPRIAISQKLEVSWVSESQGPMAEEVVMLDVVHDRNVPWHEERRRIGCAT